MELSSIENKIKTIMSHIFEIDVQEISDQTSNETVELWDSLNHLNLMVSFEEAFGIDISENEIEKMVNYKEIKKTITGLLK